MFHIGLVVWLPYGYNLYNGCYCVHLIVASNYDNVNFISDFSIVPTWGIRRQIGKHFNYETGIGIGYIHFFNPTNISFDNEADLALNLHLRLGYCF